MDRRRTFPKRYALPRVGLQASQMVEEHFCEHWRASWASEQGGEKASLIIQAAVKTSGILSVLTLDSCCAEAHSAGVPLLFVSGQPGDQHTSFCGRAAPHAHTLVNTKGRSNLGIET